MKSDLDLRSTRPSFAAMATLLIGASLTVSGCALVEKFQGDRYVAQQTKEAQQAAEAPAPAPVPPVATAPATVPAPAPETPPPAPAAIEPPAVASGLALTVGTYACELNRHVIVKSIAPDGKTMGLGWAGKEHNLTAVRAQSGALRYDDTTSGLSWITIVGKSLLLDVKAGQQLANECKYASASTSDPTPPPAAAPAKRPAKRGTAAKKEG